MKAVLLTLTSFVAGVVGYADPAPSTTSVNGTQPTVTVVAPKEETGLALDATTKSYVAKPGETSAVYRFHVRNVSKADITINQVRTSCGCTIAQLPSQPWKLAPGDSGDITLTLDLAGKTGTLIKSATIDTATGFKNLTVQATIPDGPGSGMGSLREQNLKIAAANRQAVFQGDCAKCHAEPTRGQHGVGLYVTACAICHDAEHRQSMVPDLQAVKANKDRAYWLTHVTIGKPGTLMPAFAKEHGGPLSTEQVESLVEYLVGEYSGKETKR